MPKDVEASSSKSQENAADADADAGAESQAQELVNQRRLRAEGRVRRDQKPRLGLWTFGIFTVGFFAGSLLMHLWGVALGDALLTVSGSTMIIGGLLGIIAALLAIRNR